MEDAAADIGELPVTLVKLGFDEQNMHTGKRQMQRAVITASYDYSGVPNISSRMRCDGANETFALVHGFHASARPGRPDAGMQPVVLETQMHSLAEEIPDLSSLNDINKKSPSFDNINADIEGRPGVTALMFAAYSRNSEECLKIISSNDFQRINAATAGGTALHIAARKGMAKVCEAILAHKDFKERDAVSEHGATALHAAARGGDAATIGVLLDAGFSPNTRDQTKLTAFLLACKFGGEKACVVFLEKAKSSLTLEALKTPDDMGRTARDYLVPLSKLEMELTEHIANLEEESRS